MDLSTIGSINQYAKSAALKTQWDLKKKSGDVTAHGKSLNDYLSMSGDFSRTREDADNEKLQKITNKVNAGAKLTDKEMEYLKEKNPQLYEKLRQIEKEQKNYEEALRHCKSRDEAQRLHMARVGEAMQAAKNGDATAAYRMNRMSESMTAFSETKEYKKLPTEAEQALERKERREAEQAEAETKAPDAPERETGQTGETEKADRTGDVRQDTRIEAAAETEKPAETGGSETDTERPAISAAPRRGAEAYAASQDAEEREKRRRAAIDAEA